MTNASSGKPQDTDSESPAQRRKRLEETIPANVERIRRVEKEVRKACFTGKDGGIHLRDIVWRMAPPPETDDSPLANRRRAAWNELYDILDKHKHPKGTLDGMPLLEYAARLELATGLRQAGLKDPPEKIRIKGSPRYSTDRDTTKKAHEEIDAVLRQQHDAGVTREFLHSLRREHPDVLEWAGLAGVDPESLPGGEEDLRFIDVVAGGQPHLPRPDTDIDRQMARKRKQFKWLAEAMALVQQRPDLSDAAIARVVGRDKATLCRNEIYKRAAKYAREHPAPPKGTKDGGGNIEATFSDPAEDSEEDSEDQ